MKWLNIKGIEKVSGRTAHWLWLVGFVETTENHYILKIWRGSEHKYIYIERKKWGDGYRMFLERWDETYEGELYFWEADIQRPEGLLLITSELIDNCDNDND
jgi:hypothetical protein